jgi:hypothetical protein
MTALGKIIGGGMAVGAFANDTGAWQTPVMWAFREREKILDVFEMTSGARLTCNYMRIGGVSRDIPPEFMPLARKLVKEFPKRVAEYEDLLLENEIVVARSRGIGVLTPEEAMEYRRDLGLEDETGLDRAIRLSYALLGLISFFTTGPDECRAWTVEQGATAPRAAGKIHSDLERGFIRAEVIRWDDLLRVGSEAAAKAQGLMRTEGKSYRVVDGEVIRVLFSVS